MRHMTYVALFSVIALACIAGMAARAQSFKCTDSSSLTETFICQDEILGELDVALAKEFRTLLAGHPAAKPALLANQRVWLRLRGDCEQSGQNDAGIVACLRDVYSRRLNAMRAPNFAENASKSMISTAICQTIAERYKPLAHAHPGGWPFRLLADAKTSGLTIADTPGLEIENAASELPKYSAAHHPPFSFPAEFIKVLQDDADAGNDGGRLVRAPNLDFYVLTRSQGSMGCDSSRFFRVRDGVAALATPPVLSQENDCDRDARSFATLDGTPIFIGTSFSGGPEMTAVIDVATWRGEDFRPACEIDLSYRPWFSDKTWNNWGNTCEGAQCEGLHQAAFKLVEASFNRFDQYKAAALAQLSAGQRAQYDEVEKLASDAPDTEADELGRLPYISKGHVYVVDIGHFTIGWRTFADLKVKFQSLKEGHLITDASFAVGVWKGDVVSASVLPASTDP